MLLLLDENLPKRLKSDFPDHTVITIKEQGWNGLKNGILIQKLIEHKFDALITFDKNLKHQQNFKKYPITVFVLSAHINKYSVLTKLSPKILVILKNPLPNGPIEIS
ncbi:MAG: hypothetical protein WBP41_19940 [Saprospiraceae bacterium]